MQKNSFMSVWYYKIKKWALVDYVHLFTEKNVNHFIFKYRKTPLLVPWVDQFSNSNNIKLEIFPCDMSSYLFTLINHWNKIVKDLTIANDNANAT